jgi:hypothetical protein
MSFLDSVQLQRSTDILVSDEPGRQRKHGLRWLESAIQSQARRLDADIRKCRDGIPRFLLESLKLI